MFLPLTVSHTQPTRVRQAFREVAGYHRAIFHKGKKQDSDLLDCFDVTPLVEDVDSLLSIDKIVRPYWERLLKECPEAQSRGQRLFLARSDPAMNAGLVPAVLAVKVALSRAKSVADDVGMSGPDVRHLPAAKILPYFAGGGDEGHSQGRCHPKKSRVIRHKTEDVRRK